MLGEGRASLKAPRAVGRTTAVPSTAAPSVTATHAKRTAIISNVRQARLDVMNAVRHCCCADQAGRRQASHSASNVRIARGLTGCLPLDKRLRPQETASYNRLHNGVDHRTVPVRACRSSCNDSKLDTGRAWNATFVQHIPNAPLCLPAAINICGSAGLNNYMAVPAVLCNCMAVLAVLNNCMAVPAVVPCRVK